MQNRFAPFFLLSFLLFCSHWPKTLCFEGENPGGKILKKCEKVWKIMKNYETMLPFSCCPLVFPWKTCQPQGFDAQMLAGPLCRHVWRRRRCFCQTVVLSEGFSSFSSVSGVWGTPFSKKAVLTTLRNVFGDFFGRRLMHHQSVSLQNAPSKRTLLTSLKRSKAGPPQLKRGQKSTFWWCILQWYVLMVHQAPAKFLLYKFRRVLLGLFLEHFSGDFFLRQTWPPAE